jgi:hypothetical protein
MIFQNIHKISYSHEEVSVNPGILTIFKCNFVISIFYQIKHLHFRYHVHTYESTDVISETCHSLQSSHQLSSTILSFQCRHIFDDFRTIEINSSLFKEFVCKLGTPGPLKRSFHSRFKLAHCFSDTLFSAWTVAPSVGLFSKLTTKPTKPSKPTENK